MDHVAAASAIAEAVLSAKKPAD